MNDSVEILTRHFIRIFWGNSSWPLIFELLFRTIFLYLYSLFLVRLIGKRGLTNLAPFELAVIVILGSVLGGPMIDMQIPLVFGVVVLTVILCLQRLFVHLTENNTNIEQFLESEPRRLVRDGVIDVTGLHEEGFSHEDLFLSLREKGVQHLGEVKGAFLETSGKLSVWQFKDQNIRYGLPLVPSGDKDCLEPSDGESSDDEGYFSCSHCGFTKFLESGKKLGPCSVCSHRSWVLSWS